MVRRIRPIAKRSKRSIDLSQEQTSAEAKDQETALPKEETQKELEEARAKAAGFLANWQRAEADFINYKKRAEQEKGDTAQRTLAVLVLELLPVLDDLERGFLSLPPELSGLTWIEGIQLIYRKLHAILERQGLTEIKTKGQRFEPSQHEAVRYADGEEGIVLAELQKGYRLSERVLRPALVVVGKGKGEGSDEKTA
jgi:molecular chaperone GrpE